MHNYGLVHIFGNIIGPATGRVHKLLCARGQSRFLFRGSQVGVYFPLVGRVLMDYLQHVSVIF